MRAIGRFLGRVLMVLVLVGAALWVFGPYEKVDLTPGFDAARVGPDLDAYFSGREAEFDDITPGVEKRVIWAGEAGARTGWSVVYVHGFSATSEEIRPVPDRVAAALGANLVFTRLRGHGRSGDAMAEATAGDWMNDLAEALAAGRATGERVLVISTSTGGTLVAAAAQDAALMQDVAGAVFVSPNFGINNPAAPMLTLPAARYWLPLLVGERRSFEPRNEGQGQFWTTEYPSVAVFPMAALVADVVALDHSAAQVPALFWYSPEDKVVTPAATDGVVAAWGGPTRVVQPVMGPEDDPNAHVVAGDILSSGQTDIAVDGILDWAQGL